MMLRSYQYTESPSLGYTMQNERYREKETAIAQEYVLSHRARGDLAEACPVCGKDEGRYFFTKWGVDYLRCAACKSIYAVCEEDVARGYHALPALQELRRNPEYQLHISGNRATLWKEFLAWAEVRAYRFMRRNRGLRIVDVGNRFQGYSETIRQSPLCGDYELRESILQEDPGQVSGEPGDIVLYLDRMQQELHPREKLRGLGERLKEGGLLFLGTRAGSGFDILALRGHNKKIYPYEHILLPSRQGLVNLLAECGFETLEVTTPGVMDVQYVMESLDALDGREDFIRCMLEGSDDITRHEFQRFLQRSGLSSFVCVIARKRRKEAADGAV